MRILHKYITQDYLITFALTLSIFTFVMCVGVVIKAVDLVAKGVSIGMIFQIFIYNMPYILMFSIPMSTMTTALLVFGRLSIDGEITAMKSAGMSLWQIVSPVVFISILLSFFCVYLNSYLAPESHYARRKALVNVGVENPINLLEEGRFVKEFPGFMIYIRKKNRDEVKGVVLYEMADYGVRRSIRAKRGIIQPQTDPHKISIDLYDVRMDQPDASAPLDPVKADYGQAAFYPLTLDFTDMYRRKQVNKKVKDMSFFELTRGARNIQEAYPDLAYEDLIKNRMKLVVEANKRLALSICCFAFTLVGIPLGMRSKRRESSRGIGVSLGIVFLFYFFIILAESLIAHPHLRPDMLVWVPVIGGEITGFLLMHKMN